MSSKKPARSAFQKKLGKAPKLIIPGAGGTSGGFGSGGGGDGRRGKHKGLGLSLDVGGSGGGGGGGPGAQPAGAATAASAPSGGEGGARCLAGGGGFDDSSFVVDSSGRFVAGNLCIGRSGMSGDGSTPGTADSAGSAQLTPLLADTPLASPSVDGAGAGGMELDDIEVLDMLGRGNGGTVFKARHTPTGRVMALKVINVQEREHRHQLLKELRTLQRSSSPYLVAFYGAFYKDPTISVALEYMDGGTLGYVLDQAKRLPERVVALLGRQVFQGLAALHGQHLLHRDIKPSNIVLSRGGAVKLTDFGISTELQDSIACADTFVGSFNYMSPERVMGQPYSYSSDIWSAGLLLLQLALGEFPYELTGVYIDLMQSIVEGPPRVPDDVSDEFRAFVRDCLQTDATARPAASALLEHPFLAAAPADDAACQAELAAWLDRNVPPLDAEAEAARAAA